LRRAGAKLTISQMACRWRKLGKPVTVSLDLDATLTALNSKVKNTQIANELALPPVKLHCSMLAEDAIKSAINNYYSKNPNAKPTDLSGTGMKMTGAEASVAAASG